MKTKKTTAPFPHRRLAVIAIALACASPAISFAASSSRSDDTSEASSEAAPAASRETQRFVNVAAVKENDELALCQVAVQRATNPEVRNLAETVLAHHQKENAELMAIVVKKGVKLDLKDAPSSRSVAVAGGGAPSADASSGPNTSGPDSSQQPASGSSGASTGADSKTAELERKQGADFDRACLDHIIAAHKEVVDLYQNAADKSDDPDIKMYVAKYLPTLHEHHQMALRLKNTLAAS